MGLFTTFSAMQFDWYRDGSSTNSGVQMPGLRILLDLDGNLATTGDRGGLVYERANNEAGNAPTDAWVTATVGASTKLWNFGLGLGNYFDIDGDGSPFNTLAQWQTSGRLANAAILGFSAGAGSGWGPFIGAVDNIGWTINGESQTSNFEVAGAAVPEPGTMMLVGAALLGLASARRRRG
ncbi:MAG: PEP-CTERM sorting domain-containing protein [Rhodoferax sp.]|nr:PEP-CTERM sorting domain-containing protein [Rhodoferax sp.]